jgi:hypothetical protein
LRHKWFGVRSRNAIAAKLNERNVRSARGATWAPMRRWGRSLRFRRTKRRGSVKRQPGGPDKRRPLADGLRSTGAPSPVLKARLAKGPPTTLIGLERVPAMCDHRGSRYVRSVTLRRSPSWASHRMSAVADLRTQDPISGIPEIGGRRPRPFILRGPRTQVWFEGNSVIKESGRV